MVKEQKDCIIIGAGELDMQNTDLQHENWQEAYVLAVDGGYGYCRQAVIEPDVVIGDFDSLDIRYREEIAHMEENCPEKIIRLKPEKDDTDMLAAIKYGLEKGCAVFRIYAGCGGRLDHTLANIQCLLYIKKRGGEGSLINTDSRIFVLKDESAAFGKKQRGCMSLFAMGEKAEGVTLKGFKYPLEEAVITNDFPIGISNEFTGAESSITVRKGELIVVLENS